MPIIASLKGDELIRAISSFGIKPLCMNNGAIELPFESRPNQLLASCAKTLPKDKVILSHKDYAFSLKWTGNPHLNGLRWGVLLLDFNNGIITATTPNCRDTRIVGVYFAPRELIACGNQERVVIFQNLDVPPPVKLFNCHDHFVVASLPGTPLPKNVLSFPNAD